MNDRRELSLELHVGYFRIHLLPFILHTISCKKTGQKDSMTTPYSAVPASDPSFRSEEHTITLDESPLPRRKSLDSDSDGSDLIYRDALDDEPFDEKDKRFRDEGRIEDGEEIGYPVEPSRVSLQLFGREIQENGIGRVD